MTKAYEWDDNWDGNWEGIAGDGERRRFEAELYRELCPAHVLHGLRATALGRSRRCDDVLFKLTDGRFAQVHLTYQVETDPCWPWTDVFRTFADWRAALPWDGQGPRTTRDGAPVTPTRPGA